MVTQSTIETSPFFIVSHYCTDARVNANKNVQIFFKAIYSEAKVILFSIRETNIIGPK
jgi:hypothetical protein